MSSQPPPSQYFPTIYYNPQFWSASGTDNSNYLLRIGTPTSIATSTSFSGSVIANTLASNTTTTVGTDLNVTNRNKLSSVKTVSGTTTLVSGDPEYINIVPTNSTAFTITLPRCDVSTKIGAKFSFFFTDPTSFSPVITIRVNNSSFEKIFENINTNSITISSSNDINFVELVCIATRPGGTPISVWSVKSIGTDYGLFAYLNTPNIFTETNAFNSTSTFTGNIVANGLIITPTELGYIDGATSNIQTQLNGKAGLSTANAFTGTNSFSSTSTFTGNIVANTLTITPTELGYIDGATSNIQTQLNDKASLSGTNTFANTNDFNGTTNLNSITNLNGTSNFVGACNFNSPVEINDTFDVNNTKAYFNYTTGSSPSAQFANPPAVTNFTPAGFTFTSDSLITKSYADTNYNPSGYASLLGNNIFQGTNTFGLVTSLKTLTFNDLNNNFTQYVSFTNPPNCNVGPSVLTQLTNKNYVDTEITTNCALVSSANTYTSINTFNGGLKSSTMPTFSVDVVNKSYADNNLSNASLLSGTNTWTGVSNDFTTGLLLGATPSSTDISTKTVNTTFLNSKLRVDDTLNNLSSGLNALANVTTGYGNIGISAGSCRYLTDGYNNIGIGQQANFNHNGYNNVSIGVNTLASTASQIVTNNVAIGTSALSNAITGADGNFALGTNCLSALTSGTNNCIMGYYGGGAMTTANYNSGVGYGILNTITSGSNNSGLGVGAGSGITTGSNNTFLGNATSASGNFSNVTAIGNSAVANANNEIAIGTSSNTAKVYGVLQTSNGLKLYSVDTVRAIAFTISSPFFYIYPVNPTANLVITLPTASASNLGVSFVIRRVGGTPSTTVNSASSNIYPTNSLNTSNSILTGGASAGYTATIACCYLSNTPTYGWFKIV